MKIAIMQPYFFPYIGYFQLINNVDKFVFYDDVNFIKGGWINRNVILHNNKNGFFTLNIKKASSYKLIKNIEINDNRERLIKTLNLTYHRAPYFKNVIRNFEDSIYSDTRSLSKICINSVKNICRYLSINTDFIISSESCPNTFVTDRNERITEICEVFNASHYVNMIGGQNLYSKEYFARNGIELSFLNPYISPYKQFDSSFKPGLSIIDIIMFNSQAQVKYLLENCELI